MLRHSHVIRSKSRLKCVDHYHNVNTIKSDECDVHLIRNNQAVGELKMINFEV